MAPLNQPAWTTLARLNAFHSVYRHRNLTRAARDLGYTSKGSPNRGRVWQLLDDLANDIAVASGSPRERLFHRAPASDRGGQSETLKPTPFAESIAPIVDEVLQGMVDLRRTAMGGARRLRVSCFPAHVHHALTQLLAECPEDIELREVDDALRSDHGEGLFELLTSSSTDLVVAPAGRKGFESMSLYSWRLTAVGTSRWIRRPWVEVDAGHLSGVPLLLSPHGHASRALVESEFEQSDADLLLLHESRSTESLMSMADAGLGVAILPSDSLWRAKNRRFAWFGDPARCSGKHDLYWRRGAAGSSRLQSVLSAARDLALRLDSEHPTVR